MRWRHRTCRATRKPRVDLGAEDRAVRFLWVDDRSRRRRQQAVAWRAWACGMAASCGLAALIEDDRALIQRVQRLIGVAALITAPAGDGSDRSGFASRVLRPVRSSDPGSAILQAEGDRLDLRLEAPEAIPEASGVRLGLQRRAGSGGDPARRNLRQPTIYSLMSCARRWRAIRGNIEAVLMTNDQGVIRDAAARGIEEIERAVSLVQTILGVRAGDARSMRLHLEFTCDRQLIGDTVELYRAAAEARNIEPCWSPPEVEVALLVDQQRMRQALSNLLDNALAYTPAGGQVTVALEVTEADATLRVLDSGPGLSENDHQRICGGFHAAPQPRPPPRALAWA